MSKFKALLIGVNDYRNPRPTKVRPQLKKPIGSKPALAKTVLVDADLPSAGRDVRTMADLLTGLAPSLACDSVEAVVLSGAADTTRGSILNWLAWLGDSVDTGDRLLLYFSGHSAWIRKAVVKRAAAVDEARTARGSSRRGSGRGRRGEVLIKGLEVALCPSDTTWDDVFITSQDLLYLTSGAFARRAGIEIALETCCACGIDLGYKGLPRHYFGDGTLPPRSFVRWDAAEMDESSHSAPVPVCSGEVQGLFTHFLARESKPGATRDTVFKGVKKALDQYWVDRKTTCKCPEPLIPYRQTPHLTGGHSEAAFGAAAQAAPGKGAKDVTWVYAG